MNAARLSLGTFCLAAIACLDLSAATAQLPGGFTRASLAGVPVHDVAERLLGRDLAATVESYSLDPNFSYPNGSLMSARFFHRPQPATAEICARTVDIVEFEPIAGLSDATFSRDSPSFVEGLARATEIALAPGCRLMDHQPFAGIVSGIELADAIRVLTFLSTARRAAAGPGALPLQLTCHEALQRDHCRGDGREALATLPLERTLMIEGQGPGGVRLDIDGGTTHWVLNLAGFGTDRVVLTMSSGPPPPF
jgi:hypothetical protein